MPSACMDVSFANMTKNGGSGLTRDEGVEMTRGQRTYNDFNFLAEP